MDTLKSLLTEHAASSLTKQLALGDFLGEHSWQISISQGTVDFGKGRVYPIQLLGTEATKANTWLWSWANDESNLPPAILKSAEELRTLGKQEHISEFTTPDLSLDDVTGHAIALAASGICRADCYYRGPYDGGAAYFLVTGVPIPDQPVNPVRLSNVLMQIIQQYPVDHRQMVLSYLTQQGLPMTEAAERIQVTTSDGASLVVKFDEQGRIAGVNAEAITAASFAGTAPVIPKEKAKPWWKR